MRLDIDQRALSLSVLSRATPHQHLPRLLLNFQGSPLFRSAFGQAILLDALLCFLSGCSRVWMFSVMLGGLAVLLDALLNLLHPAFVQNKWV